jgi:inosine-uridine nucleoside N-ribohydrolase
MSIRCLLPKVIEVILAPGLEMLGTPRRISIATLIDTDPGIDDALALLLAWGSPELDVEAITTVAGNVRIETATRNLDRLLALRRPPRRPRVGVGAADPLARPLVTAEHYHGVDGLGDLIDWSAEDSDGPTPSGEPRPRAADLIVDLATRRGAALTLIALGPLTNLALALEVDAAHVASIGRVVVMGGAVDVPGNVTSTAEFNIHVDPDAAARVLDAGLSLDLVPLDATRQARLTRAELEAALRCTPGPLADRIAAFTAHAFRADDTRGMALHDPLAVGVAIDPGLVEWERARIAIERDGQTRRVPGPPNCRFARVVDARRFLAMFLSRLCTGPAT